MRGEPLPGGRAPPELDGFLPTAVGAPPGRPDLRLHARWGAYSEGSDPAYASLVVAVPRTGRIGRAYALTSLGPPVLHLLGVPLPPGGSAAVAKFVERHRAALLDHRIGVTDRLDLLGTIEDGERGGG